MAMKPNKAFGVVGIVICGAMLTAGLVLTLLQWNLRAEFNLFGRAYRLYIQAFDGKVVGGVSTAWLMLLSAVGGALAVMFARGLFKAIWHVRAAARVEAVRAAAQTAEQGRGEDESGKSN